MRILYAVAVWGCLVFVVGCGGGSMSSGGGGGTTPATATVTVSTTTTGPFSLAMSTSFQPAEWDYQFFTMNPTATTTLQNLGPNHIRLQGQSEGIPQGSQGTSSTAWNFSVLDAIVQPVLSVGDHSPEFQIAKAPAFLYVNDDDTQSFASTTDFSAFAAHAQNLVQYYNTGGFTANGTLYIFPSWPTDKITYWAIYNEPSINNNLTASEYTTMYNTLVPAMQAADPSLKFVALEMCCSSESWALTFAAGVTAQVAVAASHYYSSCNQKDTDEMLMSTVPGFVTSVQTIQTNLATNPLLVNVPVWVTENNVNADYDAGNGMSACNPGQTFVIDLRGTSPVFAAWRPYVFSQFGKAGVQALYHWDFDADQQFGEVLYDNDQIELSYWVDYWLGQIFPASAGSNVLSYTSTDNADLETLPVINSDGSVVVMVSNHTIDNPATDNNGPGVAQSVLVDVSALGTFSSASQLVIDKDTNVATGPRATSVTPAGQMTIDLNGYSVGFLILKP